MRTCTWCFQVVTAMIMVLICSPCFAAGDVKWSEFKAENREVTLKVSTPSADFAWTDMVVLCEIRNASRKTIFSYWIYEVGGLRFSLANEKGEEVPLTERGKLVLSDLTGEIRKYAGQELPPGAKLKYELKLCDYFLPPKAGTYKLSVVWNSDPADSNQSGNIRVELKDIAFKVTKV